jgi:DNA-binding response OmpR family regulator
MNKVLIIEDDFELVKLYERIFALENMELITAGDGEEGLEKTATEKPSLILLDIMMPKMDGFQVLLRLKSNAETKNIPVIVLTNLSGIKDAESCLYIGAAKYLVKSETEPKQVVQEVKNILSAVPGN